MAPLEPQKKVLVSSDFFSSDHGDIECESCHGGNPSAATKDQAHEGLERKPSFNTPEQACGECHEEITATVPQSLHVTLAPFTTMLKARADMAKWEETDKARERHCAYCHTSCGGCHVNRPDSVGNGFIKGHVFNKRPDLLNQCTACHGSRIRNEYLGLRGQGDIHASKANMDCVACHSGDELHAAAPEGIQDRFHSPEQVRCMDCHKDLQYGSIRDHSIHIGKVQCQVSHSQTYTNCYSCHTGSDEKGLPFFINKKDEEDMKIGLNHDKKAPDADFDFMLVRHIPVDPTLFEHYVPNAPANFDALPTWKRTAPHNIQRRTWQTATCNHCHGNRDLFLSESDLQDFTKAANHNVVVPNARVPRPVARTRTLTIDTSGVKPERVVDAPWLKQNLGKKDMVLVDVRSRVDYDAGHIPGAIFLDPVTELRWPWDSDRPQELLSPETIAEVIGNKGMSETDHIVVYDGDGWRAGFTLSILDYVGAKRISFLKGGIQTWRFSGFPLSKEPVEVQAKTFRPTPQPRFIVNNEYVLSNLDNLSVRVVDIRTLDHSKGLAKHPRALRAGRVPGSIKFPVFGLYKDHADLKTPEELLFALRNRGITPDKTIILTCNTGAWAGAGFFMLRYLGFPDVRIHDAAWVGWERFVRYPECRYP